MDSPTTTMSASNTSNALSVTMWRLVTFIGHVVDSTIDNLEGVIMHTCVIASVISYICLHFLNNSSHAKCAEMNRRRSKMNSSNASSVNFRNESDPSQEIFLGREIFEEKFCLGGTRENPYRRTSSASAGPQISLMRVLRGLRDSREWQRTNAGREEIIFGCPPLCRTMHKEFCRRAFCRATVLPSFQ